MGGVLPGGIRVRGLSGGEQRRLSIACALVAQPAILFLDEPTTGAGSYPLHNVKLSSHDTSGYCSSWNFTIQASQSALVAECAACFEGTLQHSDWHAAHSSPQAQSKQMKLSKVSKSRTCP